MKTDRRISVLLVLLLLLPAENRIFSFDEGSGITSPSTKGDSFVDRVVSYRIGDGGGGNEEKLPEIVFGPPRGAGLLIAGTHVFSLGHGGEIVLEFTDNEVVDDPGPDLIVFENPFLQEPGNNPHTGFFELAKVEVSFDGEHWTTFPYDTGSKKGCAGWHPVFANSRENAIPPDNPEKAGGDPFDLHDLKLESIRFIRITDLNNTQGLDKSVGFDLDSVVAVHSRPRRNFSPDPKP